MHYRVIDVAQDVGQWAQVIADAGVTTVVRYFNHQNSRALPTKCLTETEAERLQAAGLSIAVVFEQNGGQGGRVEDFAPTQADRDVQRALVLSAAIGQPRGSAIYFAVDWDFVAAADLAAVETYFAVISQRLSAADLRTGVYGSGTVADRLLRARSADLVWLSGSMGWSGTRAFRASDRWALFQEGLELTFPHAGFDCDGNLVNPANADFGQFGGGGTV